MKFAEAIGAPLFNGNGWANSSLIQSKPLRTIVSQKILRHLIEDSSIILNVKSNSLQAIDVHQFSDMSNVGTNVSDSSMSEIYV